jgi:hypothetical protein
MTSFNQSNNNLNTVPLTSHVQLAYLSLTSKLSIIYYLQQAIISQVTLHLQDSK